MLSNTHHTLYTEVDGKFFRTLVFRDDERVNAFLSDHPDYGVINEDNHGNIYIAHSDPRF